MSDTTKREFPPRLHGGEIIGGEHDGEWIASTDMLQKPGALPLDEWVSKSEHNAIVERIRLDHEALNTNQDMEMVKLKAQNERLRKGIVEFSEAYEEADHCQCCQRNSLSLEKLEALSGEGEDELYKKKN